MLVLSGCELEVTDPTDPNCEDCADESPGHEVLYDISSCVDLSASDLAIINQLEAAVSTAGPNAGPDGEFHAGAIFNTIEELGRFGCRRSLETLVNEGKRIDGTRYVDGSGILRFEFLGYRKLHAILLAIAGIETRTPEADALLNKFRLEPLVLEGGLNTQQRIAEALAIHPQVDLIASVYKRFQYAWNPGLPSCSTSYLQTDGTRIGFVPNWDSYRASIGQVARDIPILLQMAGEPVYCDGANGFSIQILALDRIELATKALTLDARIDVLNSNRFRGSQIAFEVMNSLSSIREEGMEDAFVDAILLNVLGDGQAIHPDELARSLGLRWTADYCSGPTARLGTVVPPRCVRLLQVAEELMKTDPSRDVRHRARWVLAPY